MSLYIGTKYILTYQEGKKIKEQEQSSINLPNHFNKCYESLICLKTVQQVFDLIIRMSITLRCIIFFSMCVLIF